MPRSMKAGDFSPHLNTTFEVESLKLELIEVNEYPERQNVPEEVRKDPFSLILCGPTEPVLEQGMYTVKHDKVKELKLFVVPVLGGGEGEVHYQIIFG